MLSEMSAQAGDVASIKKIDGAAERLVFDALVVGQVQSCSKGWPIDVVFQSWPARKSSFASDRQLGIAQAQGSVEYLLIAGLTKSGMKFANKLGSRWMTSR
jgi:hypothetical protein